MRPRREDLLVMKEHIEAGRGRRSSSGGIHWARPPGRWGAWRGGHAQGKSVISG
ncbi:uncharacterized protein SOCEGT47_007830 [Sorangium cellulosum]|uniref:Uncharacterized protein n=1 Tax=Sorangium cellulosum TaxID=56 RepID=A0A4P2PU84_SORCE|nr:hypothetical protein [Sorangium cellulosum]AUX20315.1 uncharacterized protein SOCEGT47_007830 [Sorangium cellulosum]